MIGGKDMVTYQDMMKCCWPAYLTVMYDAEKVGMLQMRNLKGNNDYALLLIASEKADCYLLKEKLAKLRTKWGMLGKFLLTNGIKWRYEVYRIELRKNPIVACLMTIRNMCYGLPMTQLQFFKSDYEGRIIFSPFLHNNTAIPPFL